MLIRSTERCSTASTLVASHCLDCTRLPDQRRSTSGTFIAIHLLRRTRDADRRRTTASPGKADHGSNLYDWRR